MKPDNSGPGIAIEFGKQMQRMLQNEAEEDECYVFQQTSHRMHGCRVPCLRSAGADFQCGNGESAGIQDGTQRHRDRDMHGVSMI
jgi:hypothetical protein